MKRKTTRRINDNRVSHEGYYSYNDSNELLPKIMRQNITVVWTCVEEKFLCYENEYCYRTRVVSTHDACPFVVIDSNYRCGNRYYQCLLKDGTTCYVQDKHFKRDYIRPTTMAPTPKELNRHVLKEPEDANFTIDVEVVVNVKISVKVKDVFVVKNDFHALANYDKPELVVDGYNEKQIAEGSVLTIVRFGSVSRPTDVVMLVNDGTLCYVTYDKMHFLLQYRRIVPITPDIKRSFDCDCECCQRWLKELIKQADD